MKRKDLEKLRDAGASVCVKTGFASHTRAVVVAFLEEVPREFLTHPAKTRIDGDHIQAGTPWNKSDKVLVAPHLAHSPPSHHRDESLRETALVLDKGHRDHLV